MHEAYEQLMQQISQAWRWRWLGVAVCWAATLIGAVYVIMLPDVYESEARIRVDADSALRPLMKGLAVDANVRDQVRLMEQTLLSRPNLEQVARKVDLDVTVNSVAEEQEMLQNLHERIKVRSAGGQLFSVTYRDTNPTRARDVVQALLTIFIESNLGESREDMEQAELFLSAQIKAYEGQLKAAEEKQARFRAENMALLSSSGSYVEKIERARGAVFTTDLALQEANASVAELEKRLKATPQYLVPGSGASAMNGGLDPNSTYGRIQSLQQLLDDLLVQYTENHPDVIATRQRLDALVKQYNQELSGDVDTLSAGPRVQNPLYEQISLKLVDARSEVSRLKQRQANAESSLEALQKMATTAPQVEAEMAALTRDYGTIKVQYESLLARRESARLSRAIETSTDSLQFRTIDPPQIPAEPSGPARLVFLFMVLLMGFGAGGGAAFVRSQLTDTFSIPANLVDTFHIPVLGTVAKVSDLAVRARGFVGNLTFFGAAAVPVVFIITVMALLPYTARLREAIEMSAFGGIF